MKRKVLVAIATEIEGHATADAIMCTIDYTEDGIRKMLKEKLAINDEPVHIEHIELDENTYYISGWTYNEVYRFSAIVAPQLNFHHIGCQTG